MAPGRATRGATLAIAFKAAEKPARVVALVAGKTAECTVGDDLAGSCSYKLFGDESEGAQPVVVAAWDAVGNRSEARGSVTLDFSAPKVTFTKQPPALGPDRDVTIEFTAADAVATKCALDGAAPGTCQSPATVNALTTGKHTFTVTATDDLGNSGSASVEFTVDADAPDTLLVTAPPAASNLDVASFSFRSPKARASFECQLDSAPFAQCTSPMVVKVSEASHTFRVRAFDEVGNKDLTPAEATFKIDRTAPTTTIDPLADDGLATRTLTFTASEAVTFACSLDNAEFKACTSPLALTALADGVHAVLVRATDAVGNVEAAPQLKSFLVDTTAPSISLLSTPGGFSNNGNVTFRFVADEPASYECRMDAASFGPCASPFTTAVVDGTHTFEVRGKDGYGNLSAAKSYSFEIDQTPPETTIDAPPPAATKNTSVTVGFVSDDPAARFECRVDTAPFAPCTSPKTASGLTEGDHVFDVRAVDKATNADLTPASVGFKVDLTRPTTTITAPADTGAADVSLTFTADEPATFECAVDTGAFAACTSPASITALADGTHALKVRATDAVGNVEVAKSVSYLVDTSGPDTAFTVKPPAISTDADATFEFTATETGSTFECRLGTDAFAACTSPHLIAGMNDGVYTFEARGVDKYGNKDLTPASYTWKQSAFAVIVTIDAAPTGTVKSGSGSITFHSNRDPNATFTCKIDSGTAAACTSPFAFSSLQPGNHSVTIVGTGPTGVVSDPATVSWTVDPRPVVTATASASTPVPTNLPSGSVITFNLTADVANATFSCGPDAANLAGCTTVNSQNVTITTEGTYTFTVVATDQDTGLDSAATVVTFTVDRTPPTPVVVDPMNPAISTNSTPTVSWTGGTGADYFLVEVSTSPTFFSGLTTKAKATTPFYQASLTAAGRYFFRVRAMDNAGNTSAPSNVVAYYFGSSKWAAVWSPPYTGNIYSGACATETTCVFADSTYGSFVTADGGKSFFGLTTGITSGITYAAAMVDENTILLAPSGQAKVYRSTDGGASFTAITLPSTTSSYVRGMAFSGQKGVLVTDVSTWSVLVTSDGGATWTKPAVIPANSLYAVTVVPTTPNPTFVASGSSGYVGISSDFGTTWTKLTTGVTNTLYSIGFAPGSTVGYAAGSSGAIRTGDISTPATAWTAVTNNTTSPTLYGVAASAVGSLATTGTSSSTGTYGALRSTANAGAAWTEIIAPASLTMRGFVRTPSGTTVYAIGDSGNMYRSTNSGATFTKMPSFSLAPSMKPGAVLPSGSDVRCGYNHVASNTQFFFGTSGFAIKTLDGGDTVTALDVDTSTTSESNYSAAFIDDKLGYVGNGSGIFKTTDGTAFTKVFPAGTTTATIYGIDATDANTVVAVASSGAIYRYDSGANTFNTETLWSLAGAATTTTTAWKGVKLGGGTGYAVGSGLTAIVRYDAANSRWQYEANPVDARAATYWNAVTMPDPANAEVAVAVGDYGTGSTNPGQIMRRTAAGWAIVTHPGTVNTYYAVAFSPDKLTGWVLGTGGEILGTQDGGLTWAKQVSGVSSTLYGLLPMGGVKAYAMGASRTVLYSDVGGF